MIDFIFICYIVNNVIRDDLLVCLFHEFCTWNNLRIINKLASNSSLSHGEEALPILFAYLAILNHNIMTSLQCPVRNKKKWV